MKIRLAAGAAASIALLAACSPESLIEEAAERAIENETGESVDLDIDLDSDDGSLTIKDENGETVIDFDAEDDVVRIETEDGSQAISGGELAEGWPEHYPLPDGANVLSSLRFEDANEGVVTYNASFDGVSGFDDAEALFRSFGDTPTADSLTQSNGARTLTLLFENGKESVTVLLNEDADGAVTGNLLVQRPTE